MCRQLGYTNASKAFQGSNVPDGTGQIWLDNVNCDGTERNLTSCSHRGWGNEDCGHHEDAGVECFSLSTEGKLIFAFLMDDKNNQKNFSIPLFNSYSSYLNPIYRKPELQS